MSKPLKLIHHNIPQLKILIIKAKMMLLLWGRGTGKTTGPIAEMAYENATSMPGSVGAIGCDSYKHLKKSILPEILKTWKKLGLVKGRDFWMGQYPPAHLGIPEPIRPIGDNPENYIFLRNGSVIKFFSYNFQSLDNGDSIDWLINDEQKLIKKNRYFETLPCIRGNEEFFGHCSRHQSILMVTDMPDEGNPEAGYLFDYYEQQDEELIELIFSLYYQIQKYKEELNTSGINRNRKSFLTAEIKRLSDDLEYHRSNAVYVSEATSVDNLHALGYNFMRNMLRTLPANKVRTSVLNIRPDMAGKTFYPYINTDHHGYTAIKEDATILNYSTDDCRIDDDIIYTQPLEICLDYNKIITCMAIGQLSNGIGRLQNILHVEYPHKISNLIESFDNYYKYLPNKDIIYYYDNTATGESAVIDELNTYKATVERELRAKGYNVISLRFPQTTHHDRFDAQTEIFCETPNAPYIFRYNEENCKKWLRAARLTKLIAKAGKDGKITYQKSKTEEGEKSTLKPIEQPHITEAVDGLMTAWKFLKVKQKMSSIGI